MAQQLAIVTSKHQKDWDTHLPFILMAYSAMDLSLMWFYFVSILCLTCKIRAVGEFCKDYIRDFDRVFSVPGDADMLNCTLLAHNVFNYTTVPYNISWYNSKTWKELTGEKGKIVVRGTTLWIFNIEMEDAGDYTCIIRTPSGCFKQSNLLIVNQTIPDTCSRPYTIEHVLTNKVTSSLSCPLDSHIRKVDNHTIQWYKECEPITNSTPLWDRFSTVNEKLYVRDVRPEDRGLYTCTVTFNLEGQSGRVSETIDGRVKMRYNLEPSIVEPVNDTVQADFGSTVKKKCRVFVPGVGKPLVTVLWEVNGSFIPERFSEEHSKMPQRIDLVLVFRRRFPFFYTNTEESDGKLYDAYIAYPSLFGGGVSGEAEIFALHMLPQFLEERCGYKLFILGRDSLPGQGKTSAYVTN
ncbi:hypothetical protein DPEC_G00048300 [Dallia pectoralis]|uniref:Uncharacterized protein n=1 Tax=Dallia pectoralis TaxID=75939 RepID=A0ACC2HAD3_DALPE|nr:hypothetical protein DPEC_G00048300 [Dallia pectoralis]